MSNNSFLGKALAFSPFLFRNRKGQNVNFPIILVIGFFGLLTFWGLLGGLQGAMSSVLGMTQANAETKFWVLLIPFVFLFSIVFWTVYYVRGGTGG